MKVTVGGIVFRDVAKVNFFQNDISEKITVEIEYADGKFDSIKTPCIYAVKIELEK